MNNIKNIFKSFPENKKGNDYFVGDIHGEYDLLEVLLSHIKFDLKADRLFSVGDVCDRGEKSIECIELAATNWFHPVIGNHELFIINYINDNIYAKQSWIMNGGEWWFKLDKSKQRKLKDIIIENYFVSLDVKTDFGIIGLVHANYPKPEWPLTKLTMHDFDINRLVWDRNVVNFKISGLDLLITGHTPQNKPKYNGFNLNIDTGSGYKPSDKIYKPSLTICKPCKGKFNFFSVCSGKVSEYTLYAHN